MLSCIWSMFSTNFRYITTYNGKYVKELVSLLPITEKIIIEKLLRVRLLLPFYLVRRLRSNLLFLGVIAVYQPMPNIELQHKY